MLRGVALGFSYSAKTLMGIIVHMTTCGFFFFFFLAHAREVKGCDFSLK